MSTPGMTLDVVKSEINKLKKEEPMLSRIALERVFGTQRPSEAPADKPITPEQARAELARRRSGQAKQ